MNKDQALKTGLPKVKKPSKGKRGVPITYEELDNIGYYIKEPRTISIRPFYANEGYTVKLELEHHEAGHDHLHVLDQKGKKRGYFHFENDKFGFCPRGEKNLPDIYYYYEKGLE